MTEPAHEPVSPATWRNRYILMSLLQVGGVAIVILGMFIGRPGLLLTEAMPITGAGIAFGGLFLTFFGPRRLARRWKTPEEPPAP